MKKLLALLTLGFSLTFFLACDKQETTYSYETKIPVFEKMSNIRDLSILIEDPKPIVTSGKIYIFKDYLLINEPGEGVHIYDNRNPASPKALNFINIPGNVDIAINDNILYADSYVDLVAINITNPNQPVLVERVEDVFPSQYVYDGNFINIITSYKDTVLTFTTNNHRGDMMFYDSFSPTLSNGNQSGGGNYGTGGSMARFTLSKNHLYTVDHNTLRLFNVSTATKPQFVKDILLGWGIETIFPYKDNLFIGSTSGMHIYSIKESDNPQMLSVYQHLTACDPVVVNDKYAFVTLRSGNFCMGNFDLLEVINIEDLSSPKLEKSYNMQNPHGLGLVGNYLYLCEGGFGLKSFNVSDIMSITENQLEHLKDMHSVDIIPGPKSLIVVGNDGVCQFDYSNKEKLKRLSCIPRTTQIP